MRNPLKKITVTFILIALIPVGFIVHELNSLNKNEQVVREIYENQLDAILYSVNQYSDDIINSWASRIDIELSKGVSESDSTSGLLSDLNLLNAIRHVYFTDLSDSSRVFSIDTGADELVRARLDNTVKANRETINRLFTYQRAGFRKMESIDTAMADNSVPVFFVLNGGHTRYRLGAMVVDLSLFIENILGPKMQSVAQEKFVITVFRSTDNAPVYSTAAFNTNSHAQIDLTFAGLSAQEDWQKKALWLLPGYYLGISLKEATMDDLVHDRIITSLSILFFLIVLLSAGIVFLYRNIKREIQLSQSKSEFVSNVSHEIRTPLSLISMYAETLEMNRVGEEKKKEYYRVIARETGRLTQIVNRILNFSQVESNKKNYDIRPFDLNELCKEILASYSLYLNESGFRYEFIEGNDLKSLYADRQAVSEAIINLLDNAIKYSRDKKQISMKTGNSGNYTFLEVKDEGMGIAKNYQHAIFEQFYRAPTGDVHTTKGSGLGLTLVKKIMEAHQGKVKVESAPDKGSTFTLYFPVKRPHHAL